MRVKRTTIQDLADFCGLSKSTVAYILREPDTCKATAATKAKVASAVSKLNYRPNPAARALSTRRYRSIGVLFPPRGGYYNELMVQLDKEMRKHNYYGIFSFWELDELDGHGKNSSKRSFQKLCDHGIDGVITTEYSDFFKKSNIPVVIYGNEWPSFDCVFPDKVAYMKDTVKYLLNHGHQNIGFLGLTNELRAKTLRKELTSNNLPVNEDWFINTSATLENGKGAMLKLLSQKKHPDAVILHSDSLMPGVLCAADSLGIRVPEDISIISYDNLSRSELFIPPLTTFDPCLPLVAEMLMEVMLKRIEKPEMPFQKKSFKMRLIERKSVKYK